MILSLSSEIERNIFLGEIVCKTWKNENWFCILKKIISPKINYSIHNILKYCIYVSFYWNQIFHDISISLQDSIKKFLWLYIKLQVKPRIIKLIVITKCSI